MAKVAILVAASVFAVVAGSADAAQGPVVSSKGFDVHATRLAAPRAGMKTLYSQNDDDAGEAIVSQRFQRSYRSYDAQGADDFVVPTGKTWEIKEVDVTGAYFNGSGPAKSENVYFYEDDADGLPDSLVTKAMRLKGTDSGTGSFVIEIPTVKLMAGHYWVSVQANCAYPKCGEWGWELRSVQANEPAAWREPKGEGYYICKDWGTLDECIGGQYGPDFMFALKGSE